MFFKIANKSIVFHKGNSKKIQRTLIHFNENQLYKIASEFTFPN